MGHTIVLVLETWAQEDQNLKVILSYASTREVSLGYRRACPEGEVPVSCLRLQEAQQTEVG